MADLAKRELILTAIENACRSTSAQEVESEASGDPTKFPALLINDQGQRSDPNNSEVGATRYFMDVMIEGYVQGGDGAAARAGRNALYLETVTALLSWPQFDGLIDAIEEVDLKTDVAHLADKRRLAFALTLEIEYAAPRLSPVAEPLA